MRKKFTLMFVALLTVAAFAATQAVKRAPASLDAPTGTELGAFIKNAVTSNPGVASR